ncbi:MAG: cation-translocating P-type ATPase [Candidatus Edwardsbacteria bacterium]|nr:cation-translocating P-type ATPase [Candidatus Edwardsbacteria bacterium]MBU1576122.1 cation-translocating P-type ATPase [Candidatus Edwardsbacteria bacterium]MBU2464016.1 cation-translocating P-type ATPase [Candidatus Edwardsbacteria bacterium]MBU2593163.1 cation-translocating P-type ATPase [Candidatus Edwardsbacteria bacterium]
MPLYNQTIEQSLTELGSDHYSGLSDNQVIERLAQYGPNKLAEGKRVGPLKIFFDQFKNIMVVILLIAAVISGLTHDLTDSFVILAIALINAVIGFLQEYRADQAMAALKKLSQPLAKVVRSGKVLEIPSEDLVPGDIILIEAGSRIPADARILEAASLKIEESSLTGESLPVEKTSHPIENEVPLADRNNMAFLGTICVYGRGRAVVAATGMSTELGKIAKSIQSLRQGQTPLQKRLAGLARILALATVILCAVIFLAGWLHGIPISIMLLTAISLAVAAIPESLPAVITIVLSFGVQKMVKKNALVKKLPAVETLGSVSVICSDKTGTLTQNQMTVKKVFCGGILYDVEGGGYQPQGNILSPGGNIAPDDQFLQLLKASCLCNDATLFQEKAAGSDAWRITGDPTEGALLTLAAKAGLWRDSLEKDLPRAGELPFDSERKMMTTIHRMDDGRYICYVKGALDNLERICLDFPAKANEVNKSLADGGQRVLALACKIIDDLPEKLEINEIERGLTFLGLAAMIDPPREEVRAAVEQCRSAGIRPVMITGDHPATALAIARELGIFSPGDLHLTGMELKALSVEELAEKIEHISLFARVSPEDKIKIVQALQSKGRIVAMTGDGVNDAPALRGADIGIAMGITGSDVSKEASDVVLLDDNFATIVAAVAEGRRIYDNIRKFVRYMLSTNSGEILTMFAAIMMNMPLPLIPIQILWINLVTDSLPALSLGLEPPEKNILDRPPRRPEESLFSHGLWQHIVWVGLLMAAGTLVLFRYGLSLGYGEGYARTMAFTCMSVYQLCHSLAIRSERFSAFTTGFFTNKHLLGSVLLVLGLQILLLYCPPLSGIFKLVPLAAKDLALSLAVATSVFWAVELEKQLIKKYFPKTY